MQLSDVEYLKFIEGMSASILNLYSGKSVTDPERLCLGIIERQAAICSSIKKLLGADATDAAELSTGILLRALLLDSILVFDIYIECFLESDLEAKRKILDRKAQQILIDDRNASLKGSIIQMFKNGEIDVKKRDEYFSKFPISTIKRTSVGQIEGRIRSAMKSLKSYMNSLARTYDLYSKYDHYNEAYFTLRDEARSTKLERINKTLRYIVHCLLNVTELLKIMRPAHLDLSEISQKLLRFSEDYTTDKDAPEPGII